MTTQIALLRGINVGAHRRVAMPALRELLAVAGYGDVRTYLQSGNVVLSSRKSAGRLERELEKEIADGLGVETRVLVRTRDEIADVIERDPLGHVADNPKLYQVAFLSAEPDAEVVRELSAIDLAPEQLVVSGREIYTWQPNRIQQSPINKLLAQSRLGVMATARNWTTVTALLALADEWAR